MAETALAGKGGTVYIPGTPVVPVANINNWTLTINAGNYDASVLGDSWRHFVPGLRDFNGAINGYWDMADTTGQLIFQTNMINSASVVIVLQTSPLAGGGFYEGTVNIVSMAISDPVDGLITCDFTYTGTGSLQHNP